MIILPPHIGGMPDEIIPTKNALILHEYSNEIPIVQEENDITLSPSHDEGDSPNSSLYVSGSFPITLLNPNEKRTPLDISISDKPMGKGWVQVSLRTAIDNPGEMIEDRQRYMASGLFNVHVFHQFAG